MIWETLRRWFNSLISSLWGLLKQILKGSVEIALAQLMDIAKKAVSDIDASTLTDEQKRKEAFKVIANYAKEKGIAAGDSIINLAIELAVAWLKSQVNKDA